MGNNDGEYYIGSYNPNDNETIATTKELAKGLIDHIINTDGDRRRIAMACSKIEEAAMLAVKSLYS